MTMNVSELKEIINIDISDVTIEDISNFTIVFEESGGTITTVDDAGNYDIISSTICEDIIDSNFVFVARGLGLEIKYQKLKEVLEETDGSELVYFLKKLKSIPSNEGTMKSVESARLEIRKLNSVIGGEDSTVGVLTLKDTPPICSSSSSSSS